MNKKKIIAGNILNLTDARYFAAQEVDYLLFDLGQVDIQTIMDIKEWVSGPAILLSFDRDSFQKIDEAVIRIGPDAVGSSAEGLKNLSYLKGHIDLFTLEATRDNITLIWDQKRYTTHTDDALSERYDGIIVMGGEESAVGVKSFDELDDIFERIKNGCSKDN